MKTPIHTELCILFQVAGVSNLILNIGCVRERINTFLEVTRLKVIKVKLYIHIWVLCLVLHFKAKGNDRSDGI